MTTWMTSPNRASRQPAETNDITEKPRHEQRGKPSRWMRNENGDTARQASMKPQHNRIIPEELLNSGADRKYTKTTGNETLPSKQQPPRPPDTTSGERDEMRRGY